MIAVTNKPKLPSVCYGATAKNGGGAQPNHYDLLHPIEEEAKKEKSFKEKFIEHHDALQTKCNIEANLISNYIGT
eukprot:13069381-Heterocapsa_arctica.AAC.1